MQNKAIQFIQVTPEQLADLIANSVKSQLQEYTENIQKRIENEQLLTREETCEFLSINPSTLHSYTCKGRLKSYAIGNRRYYKRSELLESLIEVKK